LELGDGRGSLSAACACCAGNKMNNVEVIYTPWSNLKKSPSMDVGQVGFHNPRMVITHYYCCSYISHHFFFFALSFSLQIWVYSYRILRQVGEWSHDSMRLLIKIKLFVTLLVLIKQSQSFIPSKTLTKWF